MHSFPQFCIDPEALVKKQTMKDFVKEAGRQANTDEAASKYNQNLFDIDEDYKGYKAPRYFGAAWEYFRHVYMDVYGSEYNLYGVYSNDDWDNPLPDRGGDGGASSRKKKHYRKREIQTEPGSPVYFQDKATENWVKKFMTNDGSRIMNYIGYAQADAFRRKAAYQARYLLFTSGQGLHWKLKENTCDIIEVIDGKHIGDKSNGDQVFWNELRRHLGLSPLLVETPIDAEARIIEAANKELDNV